MQGFVNPRRAKGIFRKTLGLFMVLSIMAAILLPAGISFAADGDFKVQYSCRAIDDENGESKDIRPYFKIYNNTDADIKPSTLTLRYWYTSEGAENESYDSWWAGESDENDGDGNPIPRDKKKAKGTFGTAGGNYYFEMGFTGYAKDIKSGGSISTSGVIKRSDAGKYTQADDYSYDPTYWANGKDKTFHDWDKVTLYHNGKLVWGIEPSEPDKEPEEPPKPEEKAQGARRHGAGELKIQYRCRKPDEKTADIRPYFQIVNNTDTDIELSKLKIRYWYTNDGAAKEEYESWWATGENEDTGGKKDMVTSTFGDAGGNHYLELGFAPEAGMLEKNGGFMETNGCVVRGDKNQYTQTDDYSYDPSFEELKDWDKVTLYQDGKLVWGIEPEGAASAPAVPAAPAAPAAPSAPATPAALSAPAAPEASAAPAPASVSNVLFDTNFEKSFTAVSGVFEITLDGNSRVYSTKYPDIDRAFAGKDNWTDYSVESDVKVLSWNSPANRVIGILARCGNSGNYYSFTYMNNMLMIRKRVNGVMIDLATKEFDFEVNRWYKFKGTVDGTSLKFYVDGVEQLSATDNTFSKGKAGVIAYKGDPAMWDNFIVGKKGAAVPEIKPTEAKPEVKPDEAKLEAETAENRIVYANDFEDGKEKGFIPITGDFEVLKVGESYSYRSKTDAGRCSIGNPVWTDYCVKSDVMVTEWLTPEDVTVGVMARFLDKDNYYLAVYEDEKLFIKRKLEGSLSDLAEKPFTFNLNQWYVFTFEVTGKELKFSVDGKEELKATDDTLPAGMAGVIQFNTGSSFWDNFSILSFGSGAIAEIIKPEMENIIAKPVGTDSFGVGMLYATREGGSVWNSKWGTNENNISIKSGEFAPDDPQLQFRGDGEYTVFGKSDERKGQLKLWGAAPRVYVYNKEKKWNNVEVTFYGYTESFNTESKASSYAGLEAVVQTDHSDDKNICYTRGYGGRLLFDGRADIEKETAHHLDNGYKQGPVKNPWAYEGKMPLKKWIGMKVISRSIEDNTKMVIEVWMDATGGVNGGQWKLMNTFTDAEGWSNDCDTCCEAHRGKVLNDPEFLNTIYLRTDGLDAKGNCQYYKYFSVREIDPMSGALMEEDDLKPAPIPEDKATYKQGETYNVYYGHLHNHTKASDGTGTASEAYEYGRNVAGMDFLGLADHSDEIARVDYAYVMDAANEHNEDGEFVTFYGFEWSHNTRGHIAVINTPDYCTFADPMVDTVGELASWLSERDGVAFLNHPGRQDRTGEEFDHFETPLGRQFVGMELWNKDNPFTEYYYNDGYDKNDNGKGYYDEANLKGLKLGASGSGDDHNGTWGTATDYRMAVLAKNKTRADIYNALKARRFYSTLDKNLVMSFEINGYQMGSEIAAGKYDAVIKASDEDKEKFSEIQLIKNGVVISKWTPDSENPDIKQNLDCAKGDYFYIKVTQKDGDEAISSPIYIQ